jgi:hypothetical protein
MILTLSCRQEFIVFYTVDFYVSIFDQRECWRRDEAASHLPAARRASAAFATPEPIKEVAKERDLALARLEAAAENAGRLGDPRGG